MSSRGRGRDDRRLGRQGVLGLLAADHAIQEAATDGNPATAPDAALAAAGRIGPSRVPVRPRVHQRRGDASRSRTTSGRTRSSWTDTSNVVGDTEDVRHARRRRSTRSWTPASGAASTSGTPTKETAKHFPRDSPRSRREKYFLASRPRGSGHDEDEDEDREETRATTDTGERRAGRLRAARPRPLLPGLAPPLPRGVILGAGAIATCSSDHEPGSDEGGAARERRRARSRARRRRPRGRRRALRTRLLRERGARRPRRAQRHRPLRRRVRTLATCPPASAGRAQGARLQPERRGARLAVAAHGGRDGRRRHAVPRRLGVDGGDAARERDAPRRAADHAAAPRRGGPAARGRRRGREAGVADPRRDRPPHRPRGARAAACRPRARAG